jgi:hypothetical protein
VPRSRDHKSKMFDMAAILKRDGVVVLSHPYLQENLLAYQSEFDKTVHSFPEFKAVDEGPYVLGGFSALGNPASFHNHFVRELRLKIHELLLPLFSHVCGNDKKWRLEQIVDRLMYRPRGASATAESWHRDVAPSADHGDLIFGGWLNLDSRDQFFSCVPGTHQGEVVGGGFATIPSSKHAELKEAKRVVRIPPASIIIFYEHIIHEVISKKLNYVSRRQFLGWRLTTSKLPLIGALNLESRLEYQAPMPLKSNQEPPMYATLHWTNHRDRLLLPWSDAVFVNAPALRETRTVKSGRDKGKSYNIVKRVMPSLRDMALPLYDPYTPRERRILYPKRKWRFGGIRKRLHPPSNDANGLYAIEK